MTSSINFMKLVMSVGMIVFVAAVAIGATGAFFSDTETSTGNTFTAGAIDLTIDSQQHYNNAVCVNGLWELEQGQSAQNPQYPVIGTACTGTWGQTPEGKDIVGEKFFSFNDIKPGDSGENTVSLHVVNNDAWVCAEISNLASADNTTTEPEDLPDLDDLVSGELDDAMIMTVWKDDGDNILETGEQVLYTGKPVNKKFAVYDSTTGAPQVGGSTSYLGVKWELPSATGNEVQTDSLTADISFSVEQARNNSNFKCVPPVRVLGATLNLSSTGWGGWSCPANHTVVGGGLIGATQSFVDGPAKFGSVVDGVNYPVYPHYSYNGGVNAAGGEEGWVVHNGPVGQSAQIYVDCVPN